MKQMDGDSVKPTEVLNVVAALTTLDKDMYTIIELLKYYCSDCTFFCSDKTVIFDRQMPCSKIVRQSTDNN